MGTKTTFVCDCCFASPITSWGASVSVNGAVDGRQLIPDDNRDLGEICWSPFTDADERSTKRLGRNAIPRVAPERRLYRSGHAKRRSAPVPAIRHEADTAENLAS
jgi:hypothetical protein